MSIARCHYLHCQLILVDNGSTDDSCSLFEQICLKHHFPYQIHRLEKNYGFGYACNLGSRHAKYPHLVICNNDLTLDPQWFTHLVTTIRQHPQAACFACTVANKAGSFIESQGISFDYSGKCLQNNHNLALSSQTTKISPYKVWGSSAALVVYKTKIFRQLDGFYAPYFAYLEDVDLSFRLNNLGHTTLLIPKAVCFHRGGATSDTKPHFRAFYTFRNWYIFIHRHYSLADLVRHLPSLTIERLRNLSYLLRSYLI